MSYRPGIGAVDRVVPAQRRHSRVGVGPPANTRHSSPSVMGAVRASTTRWRPRISFVDGRPRSSSSGLSASSTGRTVTVVRPDDETITAIDAGTAVAAVPAALPHLPNAVRLTVSVARPARSG